MTRLVILSQQKARPSVVETRLQDREQDVPSQPKSRRTANNPGTQSQEEDAFAAGCVSLVLLAAILLFYRFFVVVFLHLFFLLVFFFLQIILN